LNIGVSRNRFCDFLADPDSRSFSRFGAIIMQFAVQVRNKRKHKEGHDYSINQHEYRTLFKTGVFFDHSVVNVAQACKAFAAEYRFPFIQCIAPAERNRGFALVPCVCPEPVLANGRVDDEKQAYD
jgi:hypothetical protein